MPRQIIHLPRVAWIIALLVVAHPAFADTHWWVGGNGFWPDAGHWSLTSGGAGGAGQPHDNDWANLIPTSDTTVWFTGSGYPTSGLYGMTLDGLGSTFTLSHGAGMSMRSSYEYVGLDGQAMYYQYGGENRVLTDLLLGWNGGGRGTYLLTDGSATVGSNLAVGGHGIGTFTQSGGALIVSNDLVPGFYADGIGYFDLGYTGVLITDHNAIVGRYGAATFNQTGGVHYVSNSLLLGQYASAAGTYNFSGGTLNVYGSTHVGGSEAGRGCLRLSASVTMNAGATLTIWDNGTLDLVGSPQVVVASNLPAPPTSPGMFVGRINPGTITLRGNLLSDTWEVIGYDAPGTFLHQSGLNRINHWFVMGYYPGGKGHYQLDAGTLDAMWSERIGGSAGAPCNFKHFGGVNQVADDLVLGELNSNASGTYHLHHGTLSVGDGIYIGGNASGAGGQGTLISDADGYIQAGPHLTIWDNGLLELTTSSSTLSVSGSASPTFNPGLLVGCGGGAGTVTLRGSLWSGYSYVGYDGDGTLLHQSGLNYTDNLELGFLPNSRGYYRLDSGTLLCRHLSIGAAANSTGTIDQFGGINQVSVQLWIGRSDATSCGTYNLHGGTLSVGSGGAFIGGDTWSASGHGTINIVAGTFNTGTLTIWDNGTLNVSNVGVVNVSIPAPPASPTGGLFIGRDDGTGSVLLRGTLHSNWTTIGHDGAGTFIHQRGLHEVDTFCTLGHLPGSSAYYRLDDGTLQVQEAEIIGFDQNAPAVFEQFGGINRVAGSLRLGDYHSASSGTYNLNGGTLSVENGLCVGGNKTTAYGLGTVNINGGTILSHGLTKVYNNGRVYYNSGTFSAGDLVLDSGARVLLSSGADKTLQTRSFSYTWGGFVDLTDNRMIVDYSIPNVPLNDVLSCLWYGSITSSLAVGRMRLGYGDNAVLQRSSFGGITFPPGDYTQVLIAYVLTGDSNLDGRVNTLDFNNLAGRFGQGGHWTNGDFNYDGVVNSLDFNHLLEYYGQTAPLPSPLLGATIPEPVATAWILALGRLLVRPRPCRDSKGELHA